MLDLKLIRSEPERVRAAVEHKRQDVDVERLLELDLQARELRTQLEALRHELKKSSQDVGRRRAAGEAAEDLIDQNRQLSERIDTMQEQLGGLEGTLAERLLWVPNIPHPSVPVGADAAANELVRSWGEPPEHPFEPKPHWEVAEKLGLIDFERMSKLAGSGFILFTGLGARLERALINFMLDLHTAEHGFREVSAPVIVSRDCMIGTTQLPKFENDMYRIESDDLFLIPTAEVSVTNIYREEILSAADLPLYLTAYSNCFRREAGSYGKLTRGIQRVHQFDKVELVKLVHPERSYAELESLVSAAATVLERLGLPYRVLLLCTGDMTFGSAKTYDLEVWASGMRAWLEVSSCTNFEDFQARRASIRFRDADKKVRFVHTLNGSGLALPRVVAAILENGQQPDGSVVVPEALRPYLGNLELLQPGR
jgi:seryl-tRNA synthetase